MPNETVGLYSVASGDRVTPARDSLAEALPQAEVGQPDDSGMLDVVVDAASPDEAEELVREALASSGTQDDFVVRQAAEKERAERVEFLGSTGDISERRTVGE